MAFINLPRGLIADLIAPLNENNSIDGRGLGRHMDRILPYVQGILISGPHPEEACALNTDQRADLFDKIMAIIHGAMPLFICITGETEESTRENLILLKKRREARNYSGPVFWVDTPLFYHSNRGLREYYEELSSLVDEPFVLYNDPMRVKTTNKSFKRSNIRTSILKDLMGIENIRGLVFCGSLDRFYNYQKAVRSLNYFRIYDGDESRFLDHPSLNGLVSIGVNLVPRAWNRATASSLRQGDGQAYPDSLQQIWDTWRYLNDLRNLYAQNSALVIRRTLSLMGITDVYPFDEDKDIDEAAKNILAIMKTQGDV